jgi:hypothetical protein
MKVKVSNLKPNPFRNLEKYEIDSYKVEALATSIKETSFWDNILARPGKDDKFEIAYGHHRLFAIQKVGLEEVDIPVRNLDDATMIRIMANENMDLWKTSPKVVDETVLVAKGFLDKELAKYESWEELPDPLIKLLKGDTDKASRNRFAAVKQQGVGQTTLLNFLGGNWKQWMIQEALLTIKEDKEGIVDREAVETFDRQKPARRFRQAVKKYDVPLSEQKAVARRIKEEDIDSEEEIADIVREHQESRGRIEKKEPVLKKELPTLDEVIPSLIKEMHSIYIRLSGIKDYLQEIESLGNYIDFMLEGRNLRDTLLEIFPQKEE